MNYAEAGTWLAAGNCGYVQRTGWGTRHIARCDAGIQEGGKPVMILELRQCYNIESERAMTFDDFAKRATGAQCRFRKRNDLDQIGFGPIGIIARTCAR